MGIFLLCHNFVIIGYQAACLNQCLSQNIGGTIHWRGACPPLPCSYFIANCFPHHRYVSMGIQSTYNQTFRSVNNPNFEVADAGVLMIFISPRLSIPPSKVKILLSSLLGPMASNPGGSGDSGITARTPEQVMHKVATRLASAA